MVLSVSEMRGFFPIKKRLLKHLGKDKALPLPYSGRRKTIPGTHRPPCSDTGETWDHKDSLIFFLKLYPYKLWISVTVLFTHI